MRRWILICQLTLLRTIHILWPEVAKAILRRAIRKDLQKRFGKLTPDLETLGAAWVQTASSVQTLLWRWWEDQIDICVTECIFARHLPTELANICCDEDREFFGKLMGIEKTQTIARGEPYCTITMTRFPVRTCPSDDSKTESWPG